MMLATFATGWVLYFSDGDWTLPFYLSGTASFIWVVIFQLTTTGEPSLYPYLKPKEKEILDAYEISYNAKKVIYINQSFIWHINTVFCHEAVIKITILDYKCTWKKEEENVSFV
jgi:hypothetical protein